MDGLLNAPTGYRRMAPGLEPLYEELTFHKMITKWCKMTTKVSVSVSCAYIAQVMGGFYLKLSTSRSFIRVPLLWSYASVWTPIHKFLNSPLHISAHKFINKRSAGCLLILTQKSPIQSFYKLQSSLNVLISQHAYLCPFLLSSLRRLWQCTRVRMNK